MSLINVHAAKTHLSRLIERALAGEDIVIARDNVPAVRLVPVAVERPQRVFGSWRGKATVTDAFFEPLDEAELRAWTGDPPA
jgi:prevent-host-death family protein